ncbi:MAG: hypothetical protein SNF33_07950 [Candidatus Algichlamydia australiensis]|nr:hypothetical protein [Chlamydiales bacterium]
MLIDPSPNTSPFDIAQLHGSRSVFDLYKEGFALQIGPHEDHQNVFFQVTPDSLIMYKHETDPIQQLYLESVGARRYSDVEAEIEAKEAAEVSPKLRQRTTIPVKSFEDLSVETSENTGAVRSTFKGILKTILFAPLLLGIGVTLAVVVPFLLVFGIPTLLAISLVVKAVSFIAQRIKAEGTREPEELLARANDTAEEAHLTFAEQEPVVEEEVPTQEVPPEPATVADTTPEMMDLMMDLMY